MTESMLTEGILGFNKNMFVLTDGQKMQELWVSVCCFLTLLSISVLRRNTLPKPLSIHQIYFDFKSTSSNFGDHLRIIDAIFYHLLSNNEKIIMWEEFTFAPSYNSRVYPSHTISLVLCVFLTISIIFSL